MNAKRLFDTLVKEITIHEPVDEIKTIAFLVLEKVFGLTKTEILADKVVDSDPGTLTAIITRINQHEPIQYILEEAHFYGRFFYVNRHVLIPRPETEQLVSLIKEEYLDKDDVSVLDIGTGSGCIAVSLAKELPQAEVFAVDISNDALQVAKRNAELLNATVLFDSIDVLHNELPYRNLSAIVSNPPYVKISEKEQMHANVLEHEPHLALFVPDNDALVFYKVIAQQAVRSLSESGKIFVEINEALAKDVCAVFAQHGFKNTVITKDIFNKDRIVIASR